MKSFVDALSFPIIGDPSQQDRHADQDDSHMGIPERNGSHTIINKEIKEKKKEMNLSWLELETESQMPSLKCFQSGMLWV